MTRQICCRIISLMETSISLKRKPISLMSIRQLSDVCKLCYFFSESKMERHNSMAKLESIPGLPDFVQKIDNVVLNDKQDESVKIETEKTKSSIKGKPHAYKMQSPRKSQSAYLLLDQSCDNLTYLAILRSSHNICYYEEL